MESDKQVFLVAQKDASIDDPLSNDVYEMGTVASILQMLKLPDGTVKVLVEGLSVLRFSNLFKPKNTLPLMLNMLNLHKWTKLMLTYSCARQFLSLKATLN